MVANGHKSSQQEYKREWTENKFKNLTDKPMPQCYGAEQALNLVN